MNTPRNSDGLRVRVKLAHRDQIEIRMLALDELLPDDHPVRAVWLYVCGLDLSGFYSEIQAVEGGVGRDAIDPKILLCLWLQATLDGIGSARELTRLCERDLVYQWICGGVGVNRDLLSHFRCAHPEALDALMTETIGTLLHQDLVSLQRVAQDGMRVRASAGKSSFRRKQTLKDHLHTACEHVGRLRKIDEHDDDDHISKRQRSARRRAAAERLDRVRQALRERELLHTKRERRKKGDGKSARCSTTDPEARNMKMADGGYRPSVNVQFATACGSRVIVGVDVTNGGTDSGQMTPMVERLQKNFGVIPAELLVDGGFNSRDDVTTMERRGVKVFAPIKKEKQILKEGRNPYARTPEDTDEFYAFRQRMQTAEAKAVYQERGSTAEFPNAGCRNRGLHQFCVRGLTKCRTLSVWQALAHNFQMIRSHGWLPKLIGT